MSLESEIAEYKGKIGLHEAEITQIKSHKDYDMLDKRFAALIKSEKDTIHDCEVAIDRLRQQQAATSSSTGKWFQLGYVFLLMMLFLLFLVTQEVLFVPQRFDNTIGFL